MMSRGLRSLLLGTVLVGGVLLTCGEFSTLRGGAYAAPPVAGGSPSAEEIRRQTEKIIARPEFRRVREKRNLEFKKPTTSTDPSWLGRAFKWMWEQISAFFEWLSGLFKWKGTGVGSGNVLVGLVYAVLAAVAVWIMWILIRKVQKYVLTRRVIPGKVYEEGDAGIAPGEIAADEYLRRAAELALQQNYRDAIAQLILGGKSHIERQGLIRYRRGLTHRDYLRALRSKPPQQAAFRTIVGVYEPICFGRRPAQHEHYETSVSGYEAGFGHA